MNNSVRPALSLGQSLKSVLKNCVKFSGRSRRSEFWWFVACYGVVFFVVLLNVLAYFFGLADFFETDGKLKLWLIIGGVCMVFLPLVLAVTVRRLHDVGKSGLMLIPGLVPVVGTLFVAYLLCEDSDIEANKYGDSPKYCVSTGEAVAGKSPSSFIPALSTVVIFVAGVMYMLYSMGIIFSDDNEEVTTDADGNEVVASPVQVSEDDCLQIDDAQLMAPVGEGDSREGM